MSTGRRGTPIVNMPEAQTSLSRLVESGVEIVIARDGRPVARLGPVAVKPSTSKRLDIMRGQIPDMSPGAFNALDVEVAKLFHDEEGGYSSTLTC